MKAVGQIVYLKGIVLKAFFNDFEIGHGYHDTEYHVQIVGTDTVINVNKPECLLSKAQIKKDILVNDLIVGHKYSNNVTEIKLIHYNENKVVGEYNNKELEIFSIKKFHELFPFKNGEQC